MTLAGTIIAGGVAGAAHSTTGNCSLDTVNVIDLGHNLEGTAPTQCGLSGPDNLIGVNPQIASLAGNGGLTQTMALGPASPALGAGGACTDISMAGSVTLSVDQRGLPRATACDIGAFQHQPIAERAGPSITGSPTFASTLTCAPGSWTRRRAVVPVSVVTRRPRDPRCHGECARSCPRLTSGRSSAVRSRPTAPTAPGRRARR